MVVVGEGEACRVCRGAAAKRCGGCHQAYYCGKGHQRQDWTTHKLLCRPYEICEDGELGRCMVAARDVRAGELVAQESPLVRGPSQVTGPVCLACLRAVTAANSEPCDACGWPLCRRAECRQAHEHRPECRWASDKRGGPVKISHWAVPHPSYECVTALRLVHARRHGGAAWTRLAALERHTDARRDTDKYRQDTRTVAQLLRRFYKMEEELTDEEVMDLWGIVQVNGHEVPVTHPPHVAVYNHLSLLEHSCVPNCAKSFTAEGALVVRAVAAVPRGQHLSICYSDALWGTANRQFHLQDTKFFTCKCARCQDPTELGTYFSALLCDRNGCGGPVLPPSLTEVTADTRWTCGRGCERELSDPDVDRLLQTVGQELSRLGERPLQDSIAFLDRWATRFHRNHYYLTEVKLAVAQRLGQDGGVQKLTDDELTLKTDLCRHLLHLTSIIAAAEVRVRGLLSFELHAALAERAGRGRGPDDPQTLLLESRKCLEDAIYLLEREPDVLPEGKMLRQAKLNKAQLDRTLRHAIGLATIPAM